MRLIIFNKRHCFICLRFCLRPLARILLGKNQQQRMTQISMLRISQIWYPHYRVSVMLIA
jgi:hypothetical protein